MDKDAHILQAEQHGEKLGLKESLGLVKLLSDKGGQLEGKMGLLGSGICSESPWGVRRVENIFSLDVFSEHSTPAMETESFSCK